jgi:hypothetical protein
MARAPCCELAGTLYAPGAYTGTATLRLHPRRVGSGRLKIHWGHGVLRVRVGCATLHAETAHTGTAAWVGQSSYSDVAELADAIARLAGEAPARCRRLRVALERPPVQLRTLSDLPPVPLRALRALVAHQASRFFRRNGEPLVTDAAWVERGTARVARAAAVAEPFVEAIAAGARAAGFVLETIAPADEAARFALLPTSERARRDRAAQRRLHRLTVAAVTAWLGAGGLFVARLAWERRVVERELAALEHPLAAVLAARRELRDAEATVRAVTAVELRRGRSLAALGAIAQALPDSAALTSLTWSDDGSGVLSGAARHAAEVVAALDRAGAVPSPRLEGPVVRERFGARDWERFTIAFGGKAHD